MTRMTRLSTGLLCGLLLTAGCATAPPAVEKPVTDFKQVAGSWNGSAWGDSGTAFRANLIIQTDGKYLIVIEQNPAFPGQFTLEGGALRYKHGTGRWVGKATLIEERGREYLRFVHDTGALWIEYERAR
jgi:hypothetical protein